MPFSFFIAHFIVVAPAFYFFVALDIKICSGHNHKVLMGSFFINLIVETVFENEIPEIIGRTDL